MSAAKIIKTGKNVVRSPRSAFRKVLENPKVWGFLARVTLFSLFFISAFNLSNSAFFFENPIFGIRFLAETLIALAAGVFGFHTVPIIAEKVRGWFEKLIALVVANIVSDFWNQQSRRMSAARRVKQKEKKEKREKETHEKLKATVLLDTSVLVDGRVVDVVKTGFLSEDLIVPKGVLDELHLISDSKDDLKRKKGRRGLDMLNALKRVGSIKVHEAPGDISKEDGVDKELVRLAKKYDARLMTMDFNLNKVAKVSGVKVLNLNELVNAVKYAAVPGEKIRIKIVQAGKEPNQGVGYLADGTMVVVAGAQNKVGKTLMVTVSKVIQTDAGKMVFCEE